MALAAPTPEAIARDDRRVARSTPETFFSRGPVSRCPHAKCLATVCRIRGWCHIAWYFRPDLCCANPCRSPEQRFDSVVASVRSLAFAAPRDPATMQAVTDLVPAQPWLQVVLGCLFGEGVSRAPASADVVGTLSTDGLFEERGVWLFPEAAARQPAGAPPVSCEVRPLCEVCCGCCSPEGPLPPLPADNPRLILFFHGGAFMLTNAETYPMTIGYELVRRTGAIWTVT